ncbi:hypothetical protein, partial [Brevundimonas sp. UBA5866]|uniref:hypothetical protein n=1 Tax=Brevundimonas sp. UBA5866 TaxID=1946132 RepID=UPI0025BEDBE6
RGEWRTLLALALRCAEDAEKAIVGEEAFLRRATLANRINGASATVFEREVGAAAADVAAGFIRTVQAFARSTTTPALRVELAGLVRQSAGFLDQRLTDKAREDFQRAHQGRPEVWG